MSDQPDSTYEFVNHEILKNFKGSGTENLLQKLQRPDLSAEHSVDVASGVFTELLMLFEAESLDIDTLAKFLELAITDESKAAIFCQVFDVFPHDERLKELLVYLYEKKKVIKPITLAQYLDPELLVQLQIVPRTSLYRQLNTHKRDEFYTQKKFNLVHEEFEGYTKMINEVYNVLQSPDKVFQVNHTVQAVEQMIGHYRLDPNRVLDILIDIFSNCIVGNHKFMVLFLKASRWWPSKTGSCSSLETLNVGGSDTAANCLALRLIKYYVDQELPETFKTTIAILIKEGFVSFGSIYNFWRRAPDEMSILEETYKRELEDKVFKASASALALAAPLMNDEDDVTASKSSASLSQTKNADEISTSASLIKHNLELQMLKTLMCVGLYWPAIFILSKYPFLVHMDPEVPELMHRLLSTIIDPLFSAVNPFTKLELETFQQEKCVANSRPMNKIHYDIPVLVTVYGLKPTGNSIGNKKSIYFYTEWSQGIPIASSCKDLVKVSREFVKFFGIELTKDLGNFSKLCDIILAELNADNSESNLETWFAYFRNYIFPTLGSISNNSVPVDKAFKVMKVFKAEERFNLYGELYQVLAKNNPHVKIFYGKAEKATKNLLKRLSKENVLSMMRQLAKISFSNPLPCFLTILQQIESYDNLNNLVVEAAGFFNEYGWDNLTLAILMRLSATGRASTQADGLNERQWIQSLASFIGKICLRYPEKVDLLVILQYLMKSFHANESSCLLVLKEMLSNMGGIQAITNLTHLQINLINCGSSLEKIVYSTIGDERFERQQPGKALCKTFFDRDKINELLILLCKLNGTLISGSDHMPLKVLANKNDDLNAVLHLLCTLVGVFGDKNSTQKLLLISALVDDYDVPIPWAFELWRYHLDSNISLSLLTSLESGNTISATGISPNLFVTFWKLKLYDLNYSEAIYQGELEKLKGKITSIKESISFARRDRNTTKEILLKLSADLKLTEKYLSNIPIEQEAHEKHDRLITEYILLQSSLWFVSESIEQLKSMTNDFMQNCVLPRAVHSSFDATFSAEFLFTLHELKTDNFSLLFALNGLFSSNLMLGTLFTCTPAEAENLGIFYSCILSRLNLWTQKEVFESKSQGALFIDESREGVSLSQFRQTIFDYHKDLLEDVTKSLTVQDYMSRRNAIIYLKNLLGIYPTVEDHCEAITEAIENVAKNDSRDDLKLSSSALIGHVKSRASTWVHMWDFLDMDDVSKAAQVAKRDALEKEREKARQIKMKAKQEAERKAQDEELRRLKEQQERSARERELERSSKAQAASTSFSYDDAQTTSERAHARSSESARGRYDKYSSLGTDQVISLSTGPQSRNTSNFPKSSHGTASAGTAAAARKPPSSDFSRSSPKPSTISKDSLAAKDSVNSPSGPALQSRSAVNSAPNHQVSSSSRPPVSSTTRPSVNPNTRPPVNPNTRPANSKSHPSVSSSTRPLAARPGVNFNSQTSTNSNLRSSVNQVHSPANASGSAEKARDSTDSTSQASNSRANLPRDTKPRQPQPSQNDLFLNRLTSSKPAAPPRSINSNIKARINEGKKEYREKNSNSESGRRDSGSVSDSSKSSRSLTPAAIPPPVTPPVASKRAPLPPQQAPFRPGYGGQYNSQNRTAPSSQKSAVPLPPPNLPPPKTDNSGENGRYRNGHKRTYDGANRYDKRQRY